MLNILVNAYACSPNWGSEQGMAWNWIKNLSQYCNLYIITEGEYKELIEKAVKDLPQKENLHFYYNPLPDRVRKMCWNQGDWRFYYYYNKWQWKTYQIALNIIREHSIDVLHQLNMIGFREPGYLWKIKDIPLVWGPIGGMELMPVAYLEGASLKHKLNIYLKNIVNTYQTKYSKRVQKAIFRADALVAAVKGVKDKVELYYDREIILINETGCYPNAVARNNITKDTFDVLWVGKMDFRKQLGLAIKCISQLDDCEQITLHIVGSGSEKEVTYYRSLAKKLGVDETCKWYGSIPNKEVHELMKKSDLLLFTSIMEGTPHVVLEAIGNNLPILCFDICGQSASVNESVGIKIPISTLTQSVLDFADKIRFLYQNKRILEAMSKACVERQQVLSWDNKIRQMITIYNNAIEKHRGKK